MKEPSYKKFLDINEDLQFQKFEWIFQTLGRILMVGFLVAALFGAFGTGLAPILRAGAIYFFLLFLFRITGKRSLGQVTMFDFVLLLIISETTQEIFKGEDYYSVMNAYIAIVTLFFLDILLSKLKNKSKTLDKILDDVPVVVFANGHCFQERMKKEDIEASDIMAAARSSHGLERMDQIKYAVLELDGTISIIPKEKN